MLPECPPLHERITKSLLGYGVIAGPFYVLLATGQGLLREGFDPARHAVSQLMLGTWGWVQIVNFVLTGLMTAAGGIGIGRAFGSGRLSRWTTAGLVVYGAGLVGAALLRPDPANGFPPGAPAGPGRLSGHGLGHLAVASAGFLGLIVAALATGAVFSRAHHRRWAWCCRATAVIFGATFAYLASGSGGVCANLIFTGALLLLWAWLTALSVHLYNPQNRPLRPQPAVTS